MNSTRQFQDIMDNRDSDGFLHLQWKKDVETKKKPKKEKKIKFKKGSWKERLYKLIKNLRKPKNVDKFHDKTRLNYILHRSKYDATNEPYNTKKNDMVLIDIGNNIYMRLTSSSYTKLGKVRRIAFEYKLRSMEDFDDKYFDVYSESIVCHDISSVCSMLVYFRQAIDGIAELQALTCSFTRFQFKIKILVYKDNDNVETYNNINKFIEAYDIGPLM